MTDADYYDVSPLVDSALAVFPGDEPFARAVALDFAHGDHLTLSSIRTTLHIGAHADAPIHYNATGATIETRSLAPYMGKCQVVHVTVAAGERITIAHLHGKKIEAPRVLFRTGSFPDPKIWRDDFNALSPELIHTLADRGVKLVGLDTPSIDPATDKILPSHAAVFARDLSILEGLVLDHVPEGLYTLIALPLKIANADASPVRAILLKQPLA